MQESINQRIRCLASAMTIFIFVFVLLYAPFVAYIIRIFAIHYFTGVYVMAIDAAPNGIVSRSNRAVDLKPTGIYFRRIFASFFLCSLLLLLLSLSLSSSTWKWTHTAVDDGGKAKPIEEFRGQLDWAV